MPATPLVTLSTDQFPLSARIAERELAVFLLRHPVGDWDGERHRLLLARARRGSVHDSHVRG